MESAPAVMLVNPSVISIIWVANHPAGYFARAAGRCASERTGTLFDSKVSPADPAGVIGGTFVATNMRASSGNLLLAALTAADRQRLTE